jgi:Tfp pilus assembly protein PilX
MTNRTISDTRTGRDGFAMVTALLVVLVLSVLAVGAAWLASTEKKTTLAEATHMSSVFSADAGGEAAINFVRTSNAPPQILDFSSMAVRSQGTTAIAGTQDFSYDVNFTRKRPKPGWGVEYLDYDYAVDSQGEAGRLGRSGVSIVVSRLFREGY